MVPFLQVLEDVSKAKRVLQGILAEQVFVVLDNVWDRDIIKHFNMDNVRRPHASSSLHNPYKFTVATGLSHNEFGNVESQNMFGRWANFCMQTWLEDGQRPRC